MSCNGCTRGKDLSEHNTGNKGCSLKLDIHDWLADLPKHPNITDIVEVRFKNTRKAYYQNVNQLNLEVGDKIAVEGSPGHDIGIVSLTGDLVLQQLKKNNIPLATEFKKIYRKAKLNDIDKWDEAVKLENETMLRARQLANNLNLNMKIGDVEYQGDKTKAIFYYIAEERVDFRELIKVFAEEFKVKIEMRQIGARQEAGRIGGIGSCGRELCCSTWITNFVSVTTNSARYQELSLNPQKLAGQCGKLKCCLNYELDAYIDAQKDFPDVSKPLKTKKGNAKHQKTDIFKRIMWFSIEENKSSNFIPVSVNRVIEIQELNKKGVIVDDLMEYMQEESIVEKIHDYENVVGQESLTRFDNKKHKRRNNRKKRHKSRTDKR
ncbi:MAG: hypothetical protein GXO79_08765 [Chlorobi bacterium]|nr:hypothetical protein [Chlorobiota bacterium]